MFQRVGAVAYRPDLSNTIHLCEALGNPHRKFRSIHIAGTNGKGSTSHMLASVLQSAGYRTGLYTSPHLKEFTERIRVNGQEVSKDFVVDFVNRINPLIHELKPSFFEITVAMAFDYFAQQKVDVAVIEVGLGGRLDSTNVITPILSLITNIGWDHKDLLGDTLEKIATEKAGIMKPGVPVIISHRQAGIDEVFLNRANALGSSISFADDSIVVKLQFDSGATAFQIIQHDEVSIEQLKLPLQGLYQRLNLPGVMNAVELLRTMGFSISQPAVIAGLELTTIQTGLKGRWQKLGESPFIYCDTGHNVDGIREVMNQIALFQYQQLHIVIGMVKDKDIADVLSLLPKDATYYFCEASIPRALPAEILSDKAKAIGLKGMVIKNVNEAIHTAKNSTSKNDFIFIGGSTFVVAEIAGL
ncbi:MAG: bifunctional folylpolyglutamate synthase/dihydrofolate synthase [Cyclobacteriaceae bacterium]|nr:bifunctional folylpolyglutamate synthase/dihydrofolate synthase [Cyclobacteriaceae bacterium]